MTVQEYLRVEGQIKRMAVCDQEQGVNADGR